MTEPLRECPDGHAAHFTSNGSTYDYIDGYQIACVEDGCWVGPFRSAKEDAIAAWNKRHEPLAEKLKAKLSELDPLGISTVGHELIKWLDEETK